MRADLSVSRDFALFDRFADPAKETNSARVGHGGRLDMPQRVWRGGP